MRTQLITFAFLFFTFKGLYAQVPPIFDPDPPKIDMLVVVAHPDDESTFGGLLPYYAICRAKTIKLMSLTSGEWGNGLPHHTSHDQLPDYSYDDSDQPRYTEIPEDALYPCYFREIELSRMLSMSGVNYSPILPRLKDLSGLQPWGSPDPAFELWGGKDRVCRIVATQIRRHRPDVIVTMAEDGFNRNPQHMAASSAARSAVDMASDQTLEFEGKPWPVKKLYTVVTSRDDSVAGADPIDELREAAKDRIHLHDWNLSCDALPGSAKLRAARANAMHKSQKMPEDCFDENEFILQHTIVGPDQKSRNDLFENVNSHAPSESQPTGNSQGRQTTPLKEKQEIP